MQSPSGWEGLQALALSSLDRQLGVLGLISDLEWLAPGVSTKLLRCKHGSRMCDIQAGA